MSPRLARAVPRVATSVAAASSSRSCDAARRSACVRRVRSLSAGTSPPIADAPSHAGAGARWVAEAVEGSLRRLGTDRIDLYQQHGPDPNVPIEETLTALDRLVRDGKVREIGNSNFSGEQIDDAESVSENLGLARFVSAQNHLNLLHLDPLQDVVPACVRYGLGVLPYFPLASGLLTGKYRRGAPPPEGTRLSPPPPEHAPRVMSGRKINQVDELSAVTAQRAPQNLRLPLHVQGSQP